MVTVTLIATIIHMNMGYEMPEALGRGLVSALIVGAIGFVLHIVLAFIIGFAERR